MSNSVNLRLRVNPGGRLTPSEVVGCESFIASMWQALERQSVVLTAERRMGKTSVLRKMHAEPPLTVCTIMRSLQGARSPDEFVRGLLADTERALPGLLKRSLGDRLKAAGVTRIGISSLAVEFRPTADRSWKDVATETIAVLDREPDVGVVLLWDELPHMVENVHHNCGPLVARELLDLLRSLRESHERVRMVFSGSVGLHHVVQDLRAHGGMWVPTHDMQIMDLPPLQPDDARYLARHLLQNENVACDDVERVAAAVAREVECVPYYVHHTVDELMKAQRSGRTGDIDEQLVREFVDAALANPLDPWQLHHYLDRIGTYYGADADAVKAILDVVARAADPLTIELVNERLGAHVEPPPIERVRDLLALLCKDHYLIGGPAYAFRLDLVRRIWLARRP